MTGRPYCAGSRRLVKVYPHGAGRYGPHLNAAGEALCPDCLRHVRCFDDPTDPGMRRYVDHYRRTR